ncbi:MULTISPECIES: type I secretion system permease/ATPase [Pseudomonas]|uniref:type I secretion system permease/ATPase n=1 Tax=Pseudomonas TaxID=286 RepID=UPI0002E99199|nr:MULTISPECIES: type I secretion system permease/ATPase [Pseudomonas]PJH85790.1 type I secretion system permease/ATPase [Pseudomonas sp. WCS365]ROM96364.1 type I secretion protein [Pseudomonas brassicacearum]RON00744.1 type I secretion protein [Pseudomonas brassicacearum]UII13818.1 Type I secretion system ATP-binding protein PrsD [Pseudomonas brassicacearum]
MKPHNAISAPIVAPSLKSVLRRGLLGAALFSGVINILALIGPVFMLEVYDRVIPSQSVPTLVALGLLALGVYALSGLLDIIRSRVMVRIASSLDLALSAKVFNVIAGASLKTPITGDALKPAHELDQIRGFIGGPGLVAFFDLPWMPVYLAVCFYIHPLFGLLAAGLMIILIGLTLITDRQTRKLMQASAEALNKRNHLGQQAHQNAEALMAMGMLANTSNIWQNNHSTFITLQRRSIDIGGFYGGISKTLRQVVQSTALALGAWLVIKGDLSGGTMIAASIIVARTLAPAEQVIATWRSLLSAQIAWKKLLEVFSLFPDAQNKTELPAAHRSLQVESVFAAPPGAQRLTLQNINFMVAAGTAVGVVGPSASGKSSLARVLVNAWAPARGHVRLDGAPLDLLTEQARGKLIGYLPQSVGLFTGTVAQNIARLDPSAPDSAIVSAAQLAGVHELILQLPQGYETQVGEGGVNLSAGQRQRVALARALFGDPFLVVLDEPNSNLDAEGEQALAKAILALKARGAIVVVIAHRTNILSVIDQVLILENGVQAAYGPRDVVLKRPSVAPPRSSNNVVELGASN